MPHALELHGKAEGYGGEARSMEQHVVSINAGMAASEGQGNEGKMQNQGEE